MSEHIKLTDYKNLVSLLSVPLLSTQFKKITASASSGSRGKDLAAICPSARDLSLCSQNYGRRYAAICPSALKNELEIIVCELSLCTQN